MSTGSAIRAGRAFVELFADGRNLNAGLEQAERRLAEFSRHVVALGAKISAAGAAITAPILAAAKAFADAGDAIHKAAGRTGMAAESLSALAHAAGQSGTSIEAVEAAVQRLQRTVTDAADGSKSAADALAAVGLSADRLRGLTPEDQLMVMADAIRGIDDPAEKAARAIAIFGRRGAQLIPLLDEGSEGMRALMEEAKRLGLVMDDEAAEAAAAMTDALGRLQGSLAGLRNAIGQAVLPMLQELTRYLTDAVGWARELAATHPEIARWSLVVGGAITAVGTAMLATGAAAKALSVSLAVIKAHPVLAGIAGLAMGLVALERAFGPAAVEASKFADAMGAQLEAGQRQRAEHTRQLERLQQLADVERMTKHEMSEARGIIRQLTDAYGDLGLSIDETTGRLVGFADAQQRASEGMRDAARADVTAAAREEMANIQRLLDEQEAISDQAWGRWGAPGAKQRLAEIEREIAVRQKAVQRLVGQAERLAAGDTAAATEGPGGLPGATAATAIDEERARSIAEENAKLHRELHQLELRGIDDAHQRRLALLHFEYDEKRRLAEEVAADVGIVEAQRAEALRQAERDFAEQRRRELEQAAEFDRQTAMSIARLRVDLESDGHERALRHLELEKQERIRAAREVGADVARIEEEFGLRERMLGAGERAGSRMAAMVAFQGPFAQMVPSGPQRALDRTAKATEETARNTRELRHQARLAFS